MAALRTPADTPADTPAQRAARPAAFLLALAVTASMLTSVSVLSTHEYRQALVAQATPAAPAAASTKA